MDEDLKRDLQDRCRAMEIPLFGVASVERWVHPPLDPWMPEEFFPQSIFPGTRSVVVIGLPLPLPVVETAPSVWYHDLYRTVNELLDQYSYRLSVYLNERGSPSVPVPRDGYAGIEALRENPVAFFSHRHAAYLAGLGTFGTNNVLLTPGYGPRVRFGSVFTVAELPPDPLLERTLCTGCGACVESCPAGALSEGIYPGNLTDARACTEHSARLSRQGISPCGICIQVCPVGEDRKRYGRALPSGPEETRARAHVRRFGKRSAGTG